jgi:hypothetical protein
MRKTTRNKERVVTAKNSPISAAENTRAETPATVSISALKPVRLLIPAAYLDLESRAPLTAINSDPNFNTRNAAEILGVTEGTMKKWRQRHHGPDYIQYGPDGTVRYSLSSLLRFRHDHLVIVGD